jgi:hypothetical protein
MRGTQHGTHILGSDSALIPRLEVHGVGVTASAVMTPLGLSLHAGGGGAREV